MHSLSRCEPLLYRLCCEHRKILPLEIKKKKS